MRLDTILHTLSPNQVILINSLCYMQASRMEEAQTYKTAKYASLTRSSRESSFQAKVLAVEAEARGSVDTSAYDLMKQFSVSEKTMTTALKATEEAAEKHSSWIWSERNTSKCHKD